jgi:hypothetical protein
MEYCILCGLDAEQGYLCNICRNYPECSVCLHPMISGNSCIICTGEMDEHEAYSDSEEGEN